jgi:(p)ppGpp synthase/HD superfamily hydrolase
MKWSARIDKAIEIAARLHGGQMRRNGITPYIVHPLTVAWMVSEYTDEEDTIIAALFHDIVEDTTGYGLKDVERDFGERVAYMVEVMSMDPEIKANHEWLESKKQHALKFANEDKEILLVLMMNHLHNLVTMYEELKEYGTDFWKKFHGSKSDKKIWEEINWNIFADNKLPEKPLNKLKYLIEEVYA